MSKHALNAATTAPNSDLQRPLTRRELRALERRGSAATPPSALLPVGVTRRSKASSLKSSSAADRTSAFEHRGARRNSSRKSRRIAATASTFTLTSALVLGISLPSYADSTAALISARAQRQTLTASQIEYLYQHPEALTAETIQPIAGPSSSQANPTQLPDESLVATERPTGDDYPGALGVGYVVNNCTDFVAWRINRDAGVTHSPWLYTNAVLTPNGGNGGEWARSGNLVGWETTAEPQAGDIIVYPKTGLFNSSTTYGHVAYVGKSYIDGSILTENYGASSGYFTRYIPAAEVQQYIASGDLIFKHKI